MTTSLERATLRPMGLGESMLLFGIPAVILGLCNYMLFPYLVGLGIRQFEAYFLAELLILGGLLFASLAAYRLEGNALNWDVLRSRYRLSGMDGRSWNWFTVGLIVMGGLLIILPQLQGMVFRAIGFTPPVIGPSGLTNVPLFLILLVVNILGEELWWRGYILPRQELTYGSRAWLVHGIMWALFHAYQWWSLPARFLTAPIIPFIAQRLRSTTPGICIHFCLNGLPLWLMILGSLNR